MTEALAAEAFDGQEVTLVADETTDVTREFQAGDTIRVGSLVLTVPAKGIYRVCSTGVMQIGTSE